MDLQYLLLTLRIARRLRRMPSPRVRGAAVKVMVVAVVSGLVLASCTSDTSTAEPQVSDTPVAALASTPTPAPTSTPTACADQHFPRPEPQADQLAPHAFADQHPHASPTSAPTPSPTSTPTPACADQHSHTCADQYSHACADQHSHACADRHFSLPT